MRPLEAIYQDIEAANAELASTYARLKGTQTPKKQKDELTKLKTELEAWLVALRREELSARTQAHIDELERAAAVYFRSQRDKLDELDRRTGDLRLADDLAQHRRTTILSDPVDQVLNLVEVEAFQERHCDMTMYPKGPDLGM